MKPLLILCLGNEILTDDALGPTVAKRLGPRFVSDGDVEVLFAPLAGFNLLDFLNHRHHVLIVDSIVTGKVPPGSISMFPGGHLTPSNGLINSHQINLPTALKLGRELGYTMPADIDILAVEALDVTTLSEQLTGEVAASVEQVVTRIIDWVETKRSA